MAGYSGLRLIGPVRTSTVMNIEPVVTILIAVILLGEILTGAQLLGGAVVIAAVMLAQMPQILSTRTTMAGEVDENDQGNACPGDGEAS